MKYLGVLLPGVLFAVACSSSDDAALEDPPAVVTPNDAGTSDAAPVEPAKPKEVCAPVHRTLTTPNTAAYTLFASDQEATDYAKTKGLKALPPGSATQTTADAIVMELYPSFQDLYPTETEGLTAPPRAVITDDPTANAFAIRGKDNGPAPWFIVFTMGAFAPTVTHEELLGVVAHELGHLVLRNGSIVESFQRHYLAPANERDVYGQYQPDDAKVTARIAELAVPRTKIGWVSAPYLGGLPIIPLSSANPKPDYQILWNFAYAKYKTAHPTECAKYDADLSQIAKFIIDRRNPDDRVLPLTDTDQTKLENAAAVSRADLLKCLPGLQRSVSAMLTELTGKTIPLDADETAADIKFAGKDFAAEMIELFLLKNTQLAALEAKTDLPVSALRLYNEEEDSDVVSARIMHSIGKEPRSMALYLLHSGDGSAAYTTECLARVEAGTAPPYGGASSDHPATCWRYWNTDRLAKDLDACPKP